MGVCRGEGEKGGRGEERTEHYWEVDDEIDKVRQIAFAR